MRKKIMVQAQKSAMEQGKPNRRRARTVGVRADENAS